MSCVTEFYKCRKPDCLRKARPGIWYCCPACSTAAEASAPYELEPYHPALHPVLCHSQSCEERSAERGGEYTWAESVARAQR